VSLSAPPNHALAASASAQAAAASAFNAAIIFANLSSSAFFARSISIFICFRASSNAQTYKDFAKVLEDQHDESVKELRKVNALFVSNMMEDKQAPFAHAEDDGSDAE
jgi:hypothetical protein